MNFILQSSRYYLARNVGTLEDVLLRQLCSIPNTDQTSKDPTIMEVKDVDKLYKFLELELRGNDPAVLKSFLKFATTAGNHLNVEAKSWSLRKPLHDRFTLLKSVHIYKKHRVQYELRTYFSFVQYKHLTGSTADTLLEYVERNLPEGVALKATKIELQKLPDHFCVPSTEVDQSTTKELT